MLHAGNNFFKYLKVLIHLFVSIVNLHFEFLYCPEAYMYLVKSHYIQILNVFLPAKDWNKVYSIRLQMGPRWPSCG